MYFSMSDNVAWKVDHNFFLTPSGMSLGDRAAGSIVQIENKLKSSCCCGCLAKVVRLPGAAIMPALRVFDSIANGIVGWGELIGGTIQFTVSCLRCCIFGKEICTNPKLLKTGLKRQLKAIKYLFDTLISPFIILACPKFHWINSTYLEKLSQSIESLNGYAQADITPQMDLFLGLYLNGAYDEALAVATLCITKFRETYSRSFVKSLNFTIHRSSEGQNQAFIDALEKKILRINDKINRSIDRNDLNEINNGLRILSIVVGGYMEFNDKTIAFYDTTIEFDESTIESLKQTADRLIESAALKNRLENKFLIGFCSGILAKPLPSQGLIDYCLDYIKNKADQFRCEKNKENFPNRPCLRMIERLSESQEFDYEKLKEDLKAFILDKRDPASSVNFMMEMKLDDDFINEYFGNGTDFIWDDDTLFVFSVLIKNYNKCSDLDWKALVQNFLVKVQDPLMEIGDNVPREFHESFKEIAKHGLCTDEIVEFLKANNFKSDEKATLAEVQEVLKENEAAAQNVKSARKAV